MATRAPNPAFDKAVERFLSANPNPDNIVRPSEPKSLQNRRKTGLTAKPKGSTRFGRGGGFKAGKGKLS